MSDRPSFEELLEHAPFLRRLARGLVGDEARADDLVQETWVAALRKPPTDRARVRGWLATVTRRLAADEYQRAAGRARREQAAARPEAVAGVEQHLDVAKHVVDAVRDLNEPYRSVIWLRYYEDLSPRDIARKRSAPLATVETQLRRGKELLRVRLDARCGDRASWSVALAGLAGLERATRPATSASLVSTPVAVGLGLAPFVAAAALWVSDPLGWRVESAPPAGVEVSHARAPRLLDTRELRAPEVVADTRAVTPPTTALTPAPQPLAPRPVPAERGLRFSGVVHADGPWSSDVHVALLGNWNRLALTEPLAKTTCAEDGTFELVAERQVTRAYVVAVVDGAPVATLEVPVEPGTDAELTLELGQGLPSCAGEVRLLSGAPPAGLELRARWGSDNDPIFQVGPFALRFDGQAFQHHGETAFVDEDGRFRFLRLGAGPHVIEAQRPPLSGGVSGGFSGVPETVELATLDLPERTAHLEYPAYQTLLTVLGPPPDGAVTCTFGSRGAIDDHFRGRAAAEVLVGQAVDTSKPLRILLPDLHGETSLLLERPGYRPEVVELQGLPETHTVHLQAHERLPRVVVSLRLHDEEPEEVQVALVPRNVRVDGHKFRRELRRRFRRDERPIELLDVPEGEYELRITDTSTEPLYIEARTELKVRRSVEKPKVALELGGRFELELDGAAADSVKSIAVTFSGQHKEVHERRLSRVPDAPRTWRSTPLPSGRWRFVVQVDGERKLAGTVVLAARGVRSKKLDL